MMMATWSASSGAKAEASARPIDPISAVVIGSPSKTRSENNQRCHLRIRFHLAALGPKPN